MNLYLLSIIAVGVVVDVTTLAIALHSYLTSHSPSTAPSGLPSSLKPEAHQGRRIHREYASEQKKPLLTTSPPISGALNRSNL